VLLITASVPLDQNAEEVQRVLIEQVEKVASTVRPEEVQRARNRSLNDIHMALTDSRRVALSLSEFEAQGDWRLLFIERDRLTQVTADDVNRVARQYLISSNRTAGLFRPVEQPKRAEIPPAPDVAALVANYRGSESIEAGQTFEASSENIERSTQRKKLGGIDLALLPKKTRGAVVHGRLRLWYGTAETLRNRETAAAVLPALMMRGTRKHSEQAIRDALDAAQTELTLGGGVGWLQASFRTTRPHLREAIALLAEILRTPSLPAAELELLRKQILTGYQSQLTDPSSRLFNSLSRAIAPYPPGTTLYRPTLEEQIERTRKLKRAQVAELHRRFLGAAHAQATFVGDFDAAEVEAELRAALGDWSSREPQQRIEAPFIAIEPLEKTIDTPDKKMAIVGRGTAFRMRTDDPDYPALGFANFMLGRSQKSRLWTALREKAGLSYSVGSDIDVSDEDPVAYLTASAIAAPENARRAQALLRQEFERWLEQPISEAEIQDFRAGYLESFRRQLGDDGYLANALLTDVRLGRAFTFRQQVVDTALRLKPEQIQQALRAHLGSAVFVDLTAGDVSKFAPPAPSGKDRTGGASGGAREQKPPDQGE
jgi:zinc protease